MQPGGSDVDEVLAAARLVQDRCGGVDLNLGCPQRCAEQGGYGAFLLTRPEHVRLMVETLVAELRVPVTVKVRVLPELADTLAFARMLQDAGAAAVTVHGRRRTSSATTRDPPTGTRSPPSSRRSTSRSSPTATSAPARCAR